MSNENNNDKHWKKDFPINRLKANQVSRRDFAKLLAVVSGGMVLGNAFIAGKAFFGKKKPVPEKQLVGLKSEIPAGATKSFTFKNDTVPYILVRTETGEFYVYEQKCTHLSCSVFYKPGSDKIECPCHNGWFDVKTGSVVQGPPPRPLKKLDVLFEGEEIYVQFPKEENV